MLKKNRCGRWSPLLAASVLLAACWPTQLAAEPTDSAIERPLRLTPGPGNPRNSEGDFIQLQDGRVLFVYSHFFGGGSDHAAARLVSRVSKDGGRSWSDEDRVVVQNEGDWNVMSVSLLRLQDGSIGLFYLKKNSLEDCRPQMRVSTDEGETWSDPIVCITDQVGYYVLNNDRAVQLESGRLVLPVALHNLPQWEKPDWTGRVMCYLSEDGGKTWRRSSSVLEATSPQGKRWVAQEPGVVALSDGRLMMYVRSDAGSQLVSYSEDGGDHWTPLTTSNIVSPVSPATIERIPDTSDLLLVWNNHKDVAERYRGKRTPLNVAISRDEGRTWENVRTLEQDPDGWYCYTAVAFVDGHVLLGHCAGDRPAGTGLAVSQITRFPIRWLYQPK